MRARLGVASVFLVALAACTWVPLSPEGQDMRVASVDEVEECTRLGRTTASVRARVAFFRRSPQKVREELATLARNEGALMGGDTVVPESPVDAGRQVFGVYQCGR